MEEYEHIRMPKKNIHTLITLTEYDDDDVDDIQEVKPIFERKPVRSPDNDIIIQYVCIIFCYHKISCMYARLTRKGKKKEQNPNITHDKKNRPKADE